MSPNTQRSEYLGYLQAKRESLITIMRAKISLAEAEGDSDLIEIDEQIRQVTDTPRGPHGLTVEDLSRATSAVQNLETQIEAMDAMVREEGFGAALKPLIEGMMRPMLITQLERAIEYRTQVQEALEEAPQS